MCGIGEHWHERSQLHCALFGHTLIFVRLLQVYSICLVSGFCHIAALLLVSSVMASMPAGWSHPLAGLGGHEYCISIQ